MRTPKYSTANHNNARNVYFPCLTQDERQSLIIQYEGSKMKRHYSQCWKCENYIESAKECNYLKIRDGNYSLCPLCYDFFLKHNVEVLRPERSRQEELKRSLYMAMELLHDSLTERYNSAMPRSGLSHRGGDNLPTVLIHIKGWWGKCDVCQEILSTRYSE